MDRFTTKENAKPELINCVYCLEHSNCYSNMSCDEIYNALSKLRYYENLEEQGKLVTLPCKVGDSFFTYSWICSASDYDYQRECEKYNECNECPYNSYEIREWKFKNAIHILNAEQAFGKSIFLSREEVEAAISSN